MVSPKLAAALGAVRRHWVLVLVPAAIGAIVAGVVSARGPQMFTATAVIDIETTAFTRLPTLTGPERVLRELQSPEYYEAVAEKAGSVDAAMVQQGLNSYSVGTPAYELRTTFTTADEEIAEPVARAAAETAMEVAQAFNEVERNRNQVIVDAGDKAMEALAAVPSDSATAQADAAQKEFNLVVGKAYPEYNLELIDSAYTLRDSVPVTEAASQRGVLENALGGAVLGLALGIVLALVRDRRGAEQ